MSHNSLYEQRREGAIKNAVARLDDLKRRAERLDAIEDRSLAEEISLDHIERQMAAIEDQLAELGAYTSAR